MGGDNVVLVRPAVRFGVFAGDLNSALVGLRAAVAEENAIQGAGFNQFFCQFGDRGGVVIAGRMDQSRGLLRNGLHHAGVAVAQGIDGDAGQEVQISLAAGIPDANALAANQGDGQASVDVK